MAGEITIFTRAGDAQCAALVRHLDQRGLTYTNRDVHSDPSASAILFGRLGRVAVPAILIGDRLIVGFDPVQLARFLPRDEPPDAAVSFGAAVRTVTRDIARDRGLPAAFGVEVGPVHADSAAAAAGIRTADVITAVGSYTLTGGAEQFRTAVGARRAGDSMTLTVFRDGAAHDVVVEFSAPPSHPDAAPVAPGDPPADVSDSSA